MSDTPPARNPTCRQTRADGFTLLELVVVLALLGLATALVAPAGFRMIDTWRRAADVDAALGTVAALGARASMEGRATRLEPGPIPDARLPELPQGWTVILHAPLHVQANGACGGARGELRAADGYSQAFEVQAPFCRTSRLVAQAP